jgi:hypothetical protein
MNPTPQLHLLVVILFWHHLKVYGCCARSKCIVDGRPLVSVIFLPLYNVPKNLPVNAGFNVSGRREELREMRILCSNHHSNDQPHPHKQYPSHTPNLVLKIQFILCLQLRTKCQVARIAQSWKRYRI